MNLRLREILLTIAALSASSAWGQQVPLSIAGSLRHPAISSSAGLRSTQISAVASGSRLATLSTLAGSFEVQVRVYARTHSGWQLEGQWSVPNTADSNIEIELHEEALAVVAHDASPSIAAVAHIFGRTAEGWNPVQTLFVPAPSGIIDGKRIRASALSNDLLALAIQYRRDSIDYSEIVAVVRSDTQWSVGPRAEIDDLKHTYAASMAASGRRVAIGFPRKEPLGQPVGVTQIMELGAEWRALSPLTPPSGSSAEGCYGCALAWDGERLAVADRIREQVWVYHEQEGTWQLPAGHTLVPPAGSGRESEFGSSVALRGDALLVGQPNRHAGTTRVGGVVPFRLIEGAWQRGTTWADGDDRPDDYGRSVVLGAGFGGASDDLTVEGDFTLNNVPQIDLRTPTDHGRWARDLALSSPDGVARDAFGGHVAADGPDRLLVSAPGAENALNVQQGRVFYYEWRDEHWLSLGELPTPPEFNSISVGDAHRFGQPLAFRGNVALVAATGYDHPEYGRDIGAVFVYEFRVFVESCG